MDFFLLSTKTIRNDKQLTKLPITGSYSYTILPSPIALRDIGCFSIPSTEETNVLIVQSHNNDQMRQESDFGENLLCL